MSNLVTPRILAQRIIRLGERGEQPRDSQLEEREVIDIIIDAAYKLVEPRMYRERGEENTKAVDSHYLFTFLRQPVKIRTSDGRNFLEIPAEYASLPWNAGVQSIRPNTENEFVNIAMIPVNSGDLDIYKDIIGSMQKQWVFEVEGNKAFFRKRCRATLCEEKILYVDITLVTLLGEIAPDKPLQVPREVHFDIVQLALELLGPTYGLKQEKDKINDNNPDTLVR